MLISCTEALSHLHTFAQAVSPICDSAGRQAGVLPLTMKRLKVTVISCPASVHHLRVCCWVPNSSSMCCPAMMCCLQSCWARDACGHKGIGVPRGPGAGDFCVPPCRATKGTRWLPGLSSPEWRLGILSGLEAWGRVQEGGKGWQPASRWGGSHVHGPGGVGGEGRHQHGG